MESSLLYPINLLNFIRKNKGVKRKLERLLGYFTIDYFYIIARSSKLIKYAI
jgi:hypothetical protein